MSDRVTNCMYPKEVNFAYAESIGRSLVLRPHPDVYASESSYHPFLYIPILPRMDHSCNLCRHCALMNSSFSRRHFVSHFWSSCSFGSFSRDYSVSMCYTFVSIMCHSFGFNSINCIIFIFTETTFDKYVISMSYRVSMHD